MKQLNLTVCIATFNEEANIEDCIKSALTLTKDVIVVDTGSEDNTVRLVRNLGKTIHGLTNKRYVEPVREFQIQKATGDWIFILDADERITQELALEIRECIVKQDFTFYKVSRKNIFGGKKWLKHGDWYPDYQIRLIKKSAFKSWPSRIHSAPIIEGQGGVLKNPLIHYFHPNLKQMVEKTAIFEDIEGELLLEGRKKVTVVILLKKYFGELYRRLIKYGGWRDGPFGIIESLYQAYSKTITYIYLYEKYQKSRSV